MRILLINVPHPSIGSRIPDGAAAAARTAVDRRPADRRRATRSRCSMPSSARCRIDGDRRGRPWRSRREARAARPFGLDLGPSGHRGADAGAARRRCRDVLDHLWRRVPDLSLARDPAARSRRSTSIVRGEGEETAPRLIAALERGQTAGRHRAASHFATTASRVATPPAPVIADLDAYRVGWELIDHARYSYWGGKRAVVVQFSRGCPHLCNYCGQRGFWTRWRHRDPDEVRRRDRPAASRARRRGDQFRRREPDRLAARPGALSSKR